MHNIFDSINIIHYIPYKDRLPDLIYQINNVGIKDHPNLHWEYTFKNTFEDVLYSNIKRHRGINHNSFNLAMAHYNIIKSNYELGREKILVLEDDICFHKDFEYYISNIPEDADLVMFDYNGSSVKNHNNSKDLYIPFINEPYYQSGAYFMNRRYMDHYLKKQEFYLCVSDYYLSKHSKDDLNRYITNVPTVLQVPYDTSMSHNDCSSGVYFYNNIGIDYDNYLLTDNQKNKFNNFNI